MKTQNNPAGRLCAILRAAKSYKKQDEVASQAWSKILEIDPNNIPLLLKRLGQVMELPEVVREIISCHSDIDQSIFLKWMPKVQRGFSNVNLTGKLILFTDPIDDAALDGLDFCSDLLSRRAPENILDKDELYKISTDAIDLRKTIFISDIDDLIKRTMIEKLDEIISAIQEYNINGSRPIIKVFQSTIGEIVTNRELYKTVEKSKYGSQLWKILARVAIVVNIVIGTIQIGESIANLLPNDPQVTVEDGAIEMPKKPTNGVIITKT